MQVETATTIDVPEIVAKPAIEIPEFHELRHKNNHRKYYEDK